MNARPYVTALVALIALPAWAAPDDTCTFAAGASTWSAIGTVTGAGVTCTGGGGTAGNDDLFVVPSGATVTVTGDITFDGTTTGTCIQVQDGGTLTGQVSEAATSGADFTITLPIGCTAITGASNAADEYGLACLAGSTCNIRGAVRSYSATPTVQSSLSATTVFYVGELILCGNNDCATNANQVTLNYPGDTYNDEGVAADQLWDTSFADMSADDIVCFYDADPTDDVVPADVNNCYEVVSIDSTFGVSPDPVSITFDVRQGTANQHGYPLARRDIESNTTNAAYVRGERDIVSAADTVTASHVYDARWIRFEDGSGNPKPDEAYKISRVTNATTNDTHRLGDPRGIRSSVASGDDFWIDYGWKTGDPWFSMVPVRFASASAAEGDSSIFIAGSYDIQFVASIGLERWEVGGASGGTWENVAIQDHLSGDDSGVAVLVHSATPAMTLGRTSISGGSATQANDDSYGVQFNESTGHVTLEDWSLRHPADDSFTFTFADTTEMTVTLRRVRSAFGSDNLNSGNFVDMNDDTSNVNLIMEDVLCDACAGDSASAPAMKAGPSSGHRCQVYNWVSWALRGGPVAPTDTGLDRCQFFSFVDIGGTNHVNGSIKLIPTLVDRFWIDDYQEGASGAGRWFHDDAGAAAVIRNGVLYDVTSSRATNPGDVRGGSLIENVAFVNVTMGSAGGLARDVVTVQSTASDVTLRNFTYAVAPNSSVSQSTISNALWFHETDEPLLDGVLLTGWADGANAALGGSSNALTGVETEDPICLWKNDAGDTDSSESNFDAGQSVQNQPIRFVDPVNRRFDTMKGGVADTNNCGAGNGGSPAPGILRTTWGMAASGLDARQFRMGPDYGFLERGRSY